MIIGNREFDAGHKCYIMGILNVTPDSFSDGGKWQSPDEACFRAEEMIGEGADIIDVGGESTRPGHTCISGSEETDRTAPVIEALRRRFDIPLSIDTSKSTVADLALRAGADMVNDVRGLRQDTGLAGVIARAGAACCLMHSGKTAVSGDFMIDMISDLSQSAFLALEAGIGADKIILDPGVGFAKTYETDLEAINRLDMLKALGYPVMLGVSRKSVIGKTLDLPVGDRIEGSLAAVVIGVVRGCSFVRVHDVKQTRRAITMAEAILGDRGVL